MNWTNDQKRCRRETAIASSMRVERKKCVNAEEQVRQPLQAMLLQASQRETQRDFSSDLRFAIAFLLGLWRRD